MRLRLLIGAALLAISCFALAATGFDIASVMNAILQVESGGKPYSIHDNSTRRSYQLSSKQEAEKLAEYLISLNHNIDMGLYQINSVHLSRGWTVSGLFDAATNRRAAETVFGEWLARAKKLYGDTVLAWQRAIGGYNAGGSGLSNGNPTYTNKVLKAMGSPEVALDRGDYAQGNTATADQAAALLGDDQDEEEATLDSPSPRKSYSREQGQIMDLILMLLVLVVLALLVWVLGPWFLRFIGFVMHRMSKKAFQIAKSGASE